MKGLYFEQRLALREDLPEPQLIDGEALIRTTTAGVCKTDLELVKGYMGYQGVLGHEFVGVVEKASDSSWVGKRVVGEINCYPIEDPRHACERTVLGIVGRDGAMAERFLLPVANLLEVPTGLADEVAVFTEPLAAGFEILEQTAISPGEKVLVIGDGRLANLIAQVLYRTWCDLTVVGKHEAKLALLSELGIKTVLKDNLELERRWDVVVEASGSCSGFSMALEAVAPRGRLVLKTTVAEGTELNLAPLVIHEVTVIGSRCGRFEPALRALAQGLIEVEPLIHARFPLDHGLEAFKKAEEPGVLKVLLTV